MKLHITGSTSKTIRGMRFSGIVSRFSVTRSKFNPRSCCQHAEVSLGKTYKSLKTRNRALWTQSLGAVSGFGPYGSLSSANRESLNERGQQPARLRALEAYRSWRDGRLQLIILTTIAKKIACCSLSSITKLKLPITLPVTWQATGDSHFKTLLHCIFDVQYLPVQPQNYAKRLNSRGKGRKAASMCLKIPQNKTGFLSCKNNR